MYTQRPAGIGQNLYNQSISKPKMFDPFATAAPDTSYGKQFSTTGSIGGPKLTR